MFSTKFQNRKFNELNKNSTLKTLIKLHRNAAELFYDSVNLQSHKKICANFTNKISTSQSSNEKIDFRFWLKTCNLKMVGEKS